jgi:FAD/FMN-containing dehydrogenase
MQSSLSEASLNNDGKLPIIHKATSSEEQFREASYGRVFNHRRPNRQPRAVVQASKPSHVKEAVQLAIKENSRVSVRSGGHSWAAWSVRDDAILVDLGNLRGIGYDEVTKVVKCSPSTTGRVLNGFLAQKGRMFAGGHCPDVGLGGFLLQGGMGWVCKSWGWACEQVVGIDVITADAKELHCSTEKNPDLFWAARGSGPGFPAIVTRFHLNTREFCTAMHRSIYVYPLSEYDNVMKWIVDTSPKFDGDTEAVCVSAYGPGSDEITLNALFTTFKQTREEAEAALQPAHDSHPPNAVVSVFCEPTTLENEYNDQALANPDNHRYCADNAYLSNQADVASALKESFTTLPSKKTFALYFSMIPTSRRPLPDMALSLQSDHYFAIYSIWEDEKDDEKCRNWVKQRMQSVERVSEGAYLGDSDFQIRRTKFWSEENGNKLMEIRRKWDSKGRICGFLDEGDQSRVNGLKNEFEWK